ncbi:hypothetical protein SCHPADRAFT_940106 [Schizopora paradoxa]|uniref:DUF6533 domain-containing protein n=1 Tax=Schizopora paradoxa TaxID=27342 RepID=A0A0H2RWH2_9AGAM|nr:hypothetical protein SCHPADRAFT_940106 [Schizopora paradoxa]
MESFVTDILVTKYLAVASALLLVYDYSLTFSDEVLLVWQSSLRLGKLLFLTNRYAVFAETGFYLVFLFQSEHNLCPIFYNTAASLSVAGSFLAESLIYLRTYAIVGGSRVAMVLLVFLNLGCLAVSVYFAFQGLSKGKFGASPAPSIMGCALPTGPKWIQADLFAMMFSEVVIAIITIQKALSQKKVGISKFAMSLYREGLLVFTFLFCMLLANVALNTFPSLSSKQMMLMLPQRVLHTIMLGRMLLHIRQRPSTALPQASWNFQRSNAHQDSIPSFIMYEHGDATSQPGIELAPVSHHGNTVSGFHHDRDPEHFQSMYWSTRNLNAVSR